MSTGTEECYEIENYSPSHEPSPCSLNSIADSLSLARSPGFDVNVSAEGSGGVAGEHAEGDDLTVRPWAYRTPPRHTTGVR